MAIYITELTFLKFFAKRYALPVPRYLTGTAEAAKLKQVLADWGGQALVKPDVLTGKRGKAGAIVPVRNVQEAVREIKRISTLVINGKLTRLAYLVEMIPAELEIYTAITYLTLFQGPALTVSLSGGMDIEDIPADKKVTIPVNIFQGLDAYQASEALEKLGCPQKIISKIARAMIAFWDLFISTGMQNAEINPWRITPNGDPYACDFKAEIDENNYKSRIPGVNWPEYPESRTPFEEEMQEWNAASYQGQAHVSSLGGNKILPILFGGGASTIIVETLETAGGSPIFLSDFGGNPPYKRMYGTAWRCFKYHLGQAKLLLILGGKANNTFIDVQV